MTGEVDVALPLKTLSLDAVPRALEKADRYRLLNEPVEAESICLDILRVDPENQEARVVLLLALTDQFGRGYKVGEVEPGDVIERLKGEYERAYYAGIVAERRAQAVLDENTSHSGFQAYDFLTRAMELYEQAIELRPAGNDDALLRWNTCARLLNMRGVEQRTDDPGAMALE